MLIPNVSAKPTPTSSGRGLQPLPIEVCRRLADFCGAGRGLLIQQPRQHQREVPVGQAFTLACDSSGLDDKEIAMSMDPPLDADRIAEFCCVVGNTIYPEWVAYQLNATLVMIQTEAERQAIIERERADRLEAENQLMRNILSGRVK